MIVIAAQSGRSMISFDTVKMNISYVFSVDDVQGDRWARCDYLIWATARADSRGVPVVI